MPRTRFWPAFQPLPRNDDGTSMPPVPPAQPLQIQLVTTGGSSKPAPSSLSAASAANGSSESEVRSDDFYTAWDKFLAIQPKRAQKTSRAARKTREIRAAAHDTPGALGLAVAGQPAERSYAQAAAECRAQVATIVTECRRLNQKFTDAQFDLDADPDCLLSLRGGAPDAIRELDFPPWVKRVDAIFDKPQFFVEGAAASDVHQGADGDCWFLAALMAIAARKELIERLCVARDEAVGVYGFVFCRDGEWHPVVVDDKLYLRVGDDDELAVIRDFGIAKKDGRPLRLGFEDEKLKGLLQKGGEALYFSHCKSDETWLPLIEKAYAKAHGDYLAVEAGWPSEGIEDLTGGVGCNLKSEDIMDRDRFWREQLMQVNKQYLFGASVQGKWKKGMVGGHAYAVLEAWEDEAAGLRLLKIRNPWGSFEWSGDWSDGSKLWTADMMRKLGHTFGDDGVFWMSYKDFLAYFGVVSRVRLFDDDAAADSGGDGDTWAVAARWTCVNVPWATDFLDTAFQFTTTRTGPVVLVLAQPDNRYFQGLTGRFRYGLHFRLYRVATGAGDGSEAEGQQQKEDEYIVRSMHFSGSDARDTRSVSAEVEDLAPGTYRVVFEITATRWAEDDTFAETILKCAQVKRDKLLSVGRRFDAAQAKGNLRGREAANAKRAARDAFELEKGKMKEDRRRTRKVREVERRRKQRVKEAMQERNKEFRFKAWQREREKEKKERETAAAAEQKQSPETVDGGSKESDVVGSATGERKAEVPTEPTTASEAAATKEDGTSAAGQTVTVVGQSDEAVAKEEDAKPSTDPVSQQLEKLKLEEVTPAPAIAASIEATATQPTDLSLAPALATEQEAGGEEEKFVYESEPESPSEMDDDDFDWDSELDGPILMDDGEDDTTDAPPNPIEAQDSIFDDDPWNAVCVVGLRVYSKEKELKVEVIGDDDDE